MEQTSIPISTVLVVDPHPMAHVPYIHAATLACLTSLGVRCISLSVQCHEIRRELAGLIQRGELPGADDELVQWASLADTAGVSWSDLQRALTPWMQAQADPAAALVWIGWLDYLVGASRKAPRFPDWPWAWAGAFYLLPPSFHAGCRGSASWSKERLLPFWRNCADTRCRGLAVLDEYWLADARCSLLNRSFRAGSRKLFKFPDVASTHINSSAGMALERAGRIRIGLLGQLSWRKGVVPFLEAACMAESCNPELEFLLAGELKIDQFGEADRSFVLSTLQNPPRNLRHLSEPIADEGQFNALVSQCDVIHVAYNNFPGSSNLLTKAAAFEIPVIAYSGQLIGRRVQDYRLGWIADEEGSSESYQDAILSLDYHKIRAARSEGRWKEYIALNNLERLRKTLWLIVASRDIRASPLRRLSLFSLIC